MVDCMRTLAAHLIVALTHPLDEISEAQTTGRLRKHQTGASTGGVKAQLTTCQTVGPLTTGMLGIPPV